jgi:hypothetical protein
LGSCSRTGLRRVDDQLVGADRQVEGEQQTAGAQRRVSLDPNKAVEAQNSDFDGLVDLAHTDGAGGVGAHGQVQIRRYVAVGDGAELLDAGPYGYVFLAIGLALAMVAMVAANRSYKIAGLDIVRARAA